jgi:hypothetical protein
MTEDQVERLRQAGISDDVIRDMMSKDSAAPSAAYIDPNTPSETFTQATTAGAPTMGPETTGTQLGAEAALLVPDALKYAGGGALGLYAAKKIGGALGNKPVAPVQPTPTTFTGGANAAFDKALSKPPAGPSMLQQGVDMARRMQEIAASRVTPIAQAVAPVARAATGIGAALMPGNMGQNYPFPQSGPLQGQEINPATGRPWTPAELQQYNAQMR